MYIQITPIVLCDDILSLNEFACSFLVLAIRYVWISGVFNFFFLAFYSDFEFQTTHDVFHERRLRFRKRVNIDYCHLISFTQPSLLLF